MKYLQIDSQLFINNRKKFSSKLKENTLAIFNSNDIMPTNADGTMPFRQNNDLFWLSGVDQEESVLVVFPNNKEKEIIFLKETSELIAIWEGSKLTKEEALNTSGISTVYWLSEMESIIEKLINKCDGIYVNKNIHSRSASEVETRDDRFRKMISEKYNKEILEVAPIMHELRSIKSETEIALIQNACNITEKGVRRILPFIKPGVMEYEIEAELMHEFLRNRSAGFAYQPIIGSGRSSCVLHYIENNKECKDGDILLMDFGAEYANYASDLTRTIPVNGKFSDRQKSVYNSVLHVMKEATKMLTPGTIFKQYNKEIGNIMESELIKLGILDKHDVLKQDPEKPLFKKYFMHGTSHYLGLDVHDVGNFDWPMKEGMVFTCEPGIYILEEELGIRLENDVLVTSNGPDDLMKNIPIEAEEIEDLMNS
ncbi:MAG: M24 family metallopeptidase [Flavobacteriales bacterium]|jgi:Xaa-Pro aminopeptidase|nr:M24 family metallopeptidase [Flavobacteriales bacterium]MBT6013216.1 M24 family metallopeptidase [Flavobacteriales bacterium]MBT7480891.1 M24 family metallopeptidase [Flavobacteriales bacterium]